MLASPAGWSQHGETSARQSGTGGWQQALPGYTFQFPRDHFSHPAFKTEWWYYTGNLREAGGREFGFELTFFREGIPNAYPNPSRWRMEHLYLGHFALTDISNGAFHYTQRMHRGALGLAGAPAAGAGKDEARVWLGDWSAEIGAAAHRLRATAKDFALELELRPAKPVVIHGQEGISRKGAAPGQASHYYSYSRLDAAGAIRLAGREYAVSGLAWMDHEFSSSPLAPEQAGWDWFSLQFDDGSELMVVQLRRRDGTIDPFSQGAYIPAQQRGGEGGALAAARPLAAADFRLTPQAGSEWKSARSGARYPLRWRVEVPALQLDLQVRATVPEQELVTAETTGVSYWEGAIRAAGRKEGAPAGARGYLEMTGYAPGSRLHR